MSKNVTRQKYLEVKRAIREYGKTNSVVSLTGVSRTTVQRIKKSRSYDGYKGIIRSDHPGQYKTIPVNSFPTPAVHINPESYGFPRHPEKYDTLNTRAAKLRKPWWKRLLGR